jgi:hypothetical protein
LFLVLAFLAPAGAHAQSLQDYVFHDDQEMDSLVSRVALYPDPLLYNVLSAASFPEQLNAAAAWADEHRYLTGSALAHAMLDDHLPWDPAVQSLLPFPGVLRMLVGDLRQTTDLGDSLLDQREDMLDAVQRMRHRAKDDGYLQSNAYFNVSGGRFISITPVYVGRIEVPGYDPDVFSPCRPASAACIPMAVGPFVTLGPDFAPWGWGAGRFRWSEEEMTTHRSAPRYDETDQIEMHDVAPSTAITD